jgi:mRNA-degrading endonuclease RelE of RelBE toxin-antitoxin system
MKHYNFEITPTLEKKLMKLKKKNKLFFGVIRNKIKEIVKNPHRYKPLKYDLKGLRRVHVKKSLFCF